MQLTRLLRLDPKPSRGAVALIVAVEWGRVARGDVLMLPLFHYADVVAPYAVLQVDTLPSADDAGLLRVWVDKAYQLEVETSVGDMVPLDTLFEVLVRAPAA